jgi:hypothetical protein
MLRAAIAVAITVSVVAGASGCITDYTGFAVRPTLCNPVGSGGDASRAYVSCGSEETCVFADESGNFNPTHTACFPSLATGSHVGQACEALNGCARGQACADDGCVTLCYVGDECAAGARCLPDPSGLSVAGRSVGQCAPPACEPAGDDACAIGCSFYADGHTACRGRAGSGASGSACASDIDCGAGLACDEGTSRCSTYCRVSGTDCPSGAACLTAGRAVMAIGGVSYGYCSL